MQAGPHQPLNDRVRRSSARSLARILVSIMMVALALSCTHKPGVPYPGQCLSPGILGGTRLAPWWGRDVMDSIQVSRGEIVKYAHCLTYVDSLGEPGTLLQPYFREFTRASITPVSTDSLLTMFDLVVGATLRSGWIIGRIAANAPYFHGIQGSYDLSDTTYVYLDFPTNGYARVTMISSNPHVPIAILGDFQWKWRNPNDKREYDRLLFPRLPNSAKDRVSSWLAGKDQFTSGEIQSWISTYSISDLDLSSQSYQDFKTDFYVANLDPPTKECKVSGLYACWLRGDFQESDAAKHLMKALEGGGSNGWIQVTGSGCVCSGSGCH